MYKGPLDERYILHNLGVDPVKLAFEMALSVWKKEITVLINTEQFHQGHNTHSFSSTNSNCDVTENSLKVIIKFCEVIKYCQNKRN